jgi:hypothetical protein
MSEVADSLRKLGCDFRRVAACEPFRTEILIAGAVAQYVIDDRQYRGGNGDHCFRRALRRMQMVVCEVFDFCESGGALGLLAEPRPDRR